MSVIIVQFSLGILLFFLINWIGKHSYSIGYMEISMFVKTEEAPALNFLIRVLSPIVYIIVISAVLYSFNLDKYVNNIFLVNIYYIAFRLIFNLVTNRGLLLNWYRQFIYWFAIVTISYFTYENIIKEKTNILPDFTTIANELWIIILVFIFQITNNIRLSQDSTIKRKQIYLQNRYHYFKKLYGSTISEITQNEVLDAIAYSILIYEDFNRPKVVRFIEYITFKLTKKEHSLGVMQVKTKKYLSNNESVVLGCKKIVSAHSKYLRKIKKDKQGFYEWLAYREIINDYNGGESYTNEVTELISTIKDSFYNNTKDSLENPIINKK